MSSLARLTKKSQGLPAGLSRLSDAICTLLYYIKNHAKLRVALQSAVACISTSTRGSPPVSVAGDLDDQLLRVRLTHGALYETIWLVICCQVKKWLFLPSWAL